MILASVQGRVAAGWLQQVNYDKVFAAFTWFGHCLLSDKRKVNSAQCHCANLKQWRHFLSYLLPGIRVYFFMALLVLWFVCSICPTSFWKIYKLNKNFLCMLEIIHILSSLSMANFILWQAAVTNHDINTLEASTLLCLQAFKPFVKAKMFWRAPDFTLEICQHHCQYLTKLSSTEKFCAFALL